MPNSFRWRAALVLLIAVVVRIGFVVAADRGVVRAEFNPDYLDYLSFAHNLATGVGFAHAVNEQEPFSQPVAFSAWRAPLYPAFLAIAFQFSRNMFFLQALQVAIAGLSLYFFLRLGFILFGEWPALIAGLIFAFYPPLILYSADLGTEGLFLLLLMAVLLVFYSVGPEVSTIRAFALGVLVGLTALCRPAGLVLAPSLALAILLRTRDWGFAVRRGIVLALAVAMMVLPWTYRNYRLFHKAVLISSNGGAVLWAGAYLRVVPGSGFAAVTRSQHGDLPDLSETERDQYYYHQAFAILDHSPRRFGKMLLGNFAAMYALVPSGLYHSARTRWVYSVAYIPVLISGLIGFWLLRRRWRELSLLWVFILVATLFYCFWLGSIRYRVTAIEPLLMLGSGVFLCALTRHDGNRRTEHASSSQPGDARA
jgi:4-amino-4-deoxy-L-arabinose transferase-like glycosyltransferase